MANKNLSPRVAWALDVLAQLKTWSGLDTMLTWMDRAEWEELLAALDATTLDPRLKRLLRKRWKSEKDLDESHAVGEIKALNLPPRQEQLLLVIRVDLWEGKEADYIARVYGEVDPVRQKKIFQQRRVALRRLQADLNASLKRLGYKGEVYRPEPGVLSIMKREAQQERRPRSAEQFSPRESESPFERCSRFLQAQLAYGPMTQTEIEQLGRERGLSMTTMRRAKRALGVQSRHEGFGPGSVHVWYLPISTHSKKNVVAFERNADFS